MPSRDPALARAVGRTSNVTGVGRDDGAEWMLSHGSDARSSADPLRCRLG